VRKRSGRLGFTLVELLVVVAIIAMLISILLPSLSQAKNSAKAVVCGSNQRNLIIASLGYNNEHADWFCPIQDWYRPAQGRAFEYTWRVYLWKYVGQVADVYDCPAEQTERYADGISVEDAKFLDSQSPERFVDPFNKGLREKWEDRNPSGIGANLAHYWEGAEGHGPYGRPQESGYVEGLTRAGGNIRSAGHLILFGDGHGDAEEDWPEDRWWIFFWTPGFDVGGPGYDRHLQGDAGAIRHHGRANYAFYDGSVRLLDASQIPCTPEECWWSVEYRPHLRHATQPPR